MRAQLIEPEFESLRQRAGRPPHVWAQGRGRDLQRVHLMGALSFLEKLGAAPGTGRKTEIPRKHRI